MKTLKLTRREFTRHTGLALLSASGLAALMTIDCSNSDNPTTFNQPPTGAKLEITVANHAALAQVGGVSGFSLSGSPIYVFRTGEATFRALSRVCTHQSCQVSWQSAARKITCPCHGSEYNEQGAVLRGPAPRALRSFPTSYDSTTGILTVG